MSTTTGLFSVLAILIMLSWQLAVADSHVEITLASDFEIQVLQYPADHKRLLIWVPSQYGIRTGNKQFASSVQGRGIDCWLVDLHESYMALTGRRAYGQFKPQHIKELIDHAVQQEWQDIFIGGDSRGAALAMQAARQWQLENPGQSVLRGLLFYHPHLIDGYTEIGERAAFLPIARATNLPTYIFQPQYSTKFLRSPELMEQLGQGGAQVFLHPLEGVQGGFHLRAEDNLSQREREERHRVGQRVEAALNLLVQLPTPTEAAAANLTESEASPAGRAYVGLVPLEIDETLPIRLYDERDQLFDLDDHKGEVILVNFWATWCRPCVKEIASLMRLIDLFKDRSFRVVTINIGESKAHVQAFLEKRGIRPNFDVLFDADGKATRDWKIYAYPSNYLLDKQHKVRYGYRGALEWDSPETVEIVQSLLD